TASEGRVRPFAACSLLVPLGFPGSHLTWRVCRAGLSTNGVGAPSDIRQVQNHTSKSSAPDGSSSFCASRGTILAYSCLNSRGLTLDRCARIIQHVYCLGEMQFCHAWGVWGATRGSSHV